VGYVVRRTDAAGRMRYTAMYRDIKGRQRSAGTFGTERLAAKAWQRAEADLAAGKIGDLKRGRQTLRRYVESEWFPHHLVEATTRENYAYVLNRYIIPELGPMPMVEILPGHVREWITTLQTVYHARPATIRKCKVILDSILTTALNDQITFLHAGKGVKTPPVPTKPRRVLTAEEFERVYAALEDDTMRLLVETGIESGLRWGELTELRVKDLDLDTGVLTVSRVVVQLKAKSRPDGSRFLVKEYPKDREWRRLRLAAHLGAKLREHIAELDLGSEDLLFQLRQPTEARRRSLPDELPQPDTLGLTEPNARGRRYRHGTTTAYTTGGCRCHHCRNAMAAYRLHGALLEETNHVPRASSTPTDTSATTGSARTFGVRPCRRRSSVSGSRRTGSDMPTPPGCWPAARTCRSSRRDWDTAASRLPRRTCIPCQARRERPLTPLPPSAAPGTGQPLQLLPHDNVNRISQRWRR
jgi:integrase